MQRKQNVWGQPKKYYELPQNTPLTVKKYGTLLDAYGALLDKAEQETTKIKKEFEEKLEQIARDIMKREGVVAQKDHEEQMAALRAEIKQLKDRELPSTTRKPDRGDKKTTTEPKNEYLNEIERLNSLVKEWQQKTNNAEQDVARWKKRAKDCESKAPNTSTDEKLNQRIKDAEELNTVLLEQKNKLDELLREKTNELEPLQNKVQILQSDVAISNSEVKRLHGLNDELQRENDQAIQNYHEMRIRLEECRKELAEVKFTKKEVLKKYEDELQKLKDEYAMAYWVLVTKEAVNNERLATEKNIDAAGFQVNVDLVKKVHKHVEETLQLLGTPTNANDWDRVSAYPLCPPGVP